MMVGLATRPVRPHMQGTMSDDDKDNPAQELKQGLTHLWRAARGAATGLKKELDRSDMGKALDDAGREFARAAVNVVDRLATEVSDLARPRPPSGDKGPEEGPPAESSPVEAKPDEHTGDDEFDGVKPRDKATGPTPQDPGFRIAIDDDDKKKSGQ